MFQQTQKPGKSNKQDSDPEQKKSLLNNAEMSKGHEIASTLGAPEHLRAEMKENQDPQKESKAAQLKANSENSNVIKNGIVDLNSNNVEAQINAYALAHGDLYFARLHNNLSSKEGQEPAQMQEEEEMIQAKKSGFDPVQFMIEGNKMLQAQIDRYNQTQKKSKPGNSAAADNVGTTTNLPEDVNSQMERAFETSFANVKIHKNSEKATQLGALAYTQGNDLYFAPGQYNPSTVKGQELIGHELTHVVQQRDGRVKGSQNKGGMGVNADKSLEKEADEMGERVAEDIHTDSSKVKNTSKEQNKPKSIEKLQDIAKEKVTLSRGVFQFIAEADFNDGNLDARLPHFPLNVYLFQKLSDEQKKDIKEGKLDVVRYGAPNEYGRLKQQDEGEYYKISGKPRHKKETYNNISIDQIIGQLSVSKSGLTIGMGVDLGNKWSNSQQEKCKNFLINKGKIEKETAEKLSECAGLKGIEAAKKTAELRETIKLTTDQVLNLLEGTIKDYDRTQDKLDSYHPLIKEALMYTRYWGNTKLRNIIVEAAKDKSGVEQLKSVKESIKAEMDSLKKSDYKISGYKTFYHVFEIVEEMESSNTSVEFSNQVHEKKELLSESDPTFTFIRDVTERKSSNLKGKDFKKQIEGKALPTMIKYSVGSGKSAKNEKDDVEVIQQLLYNAGYDIEVNGILEEKTKEAIKKFTKSIFKKEYDTIYPDKKAIKHLNKYKYKTRNNETEKTDS